MTKKYNKLLQFVKKNNIDVDSNEAVKRELEIIKNSNNPDIKFNSSYLGLYDLSDFEVIQKMNLTPINPLISLKTLDELLDQDKQRVNDGFPRRIRLGKLVKPLQGNKSKVVIVPTTTEPKFYHDNSITEDDEDSTGGSGEGEEGEVIGEQQAQPQQGEGEGQGAGEGNSAGHDISQEAFDLGKIITEKFQLPNLKDKGSKKSFSKYIYDLTDRNRGFGQLLDKKATLKKVIETNILLDNIKGGEYFNPENLILNPKDQIFRILSQEKDFETQAVVFFVRDYSGSMQGEPTEAITTQHLLIYSWLMFQYQNNVVTKFIVHDTDAKEVEDFYTYYRSQVAGGTKVAPAFKLVNKIIDENQYQKDYNIYIFYGTDGDDWDNDGKELLENIDILLNKVNRIGITVAKNGWSSNEAKTTVEKNIEKSGYLQSKSDLIKMDTFKSKGVSEDRIIEGIKKIVGE